MKAKITVGTMLTLLLVGTLLSALPTKAVWAGDITIGIIGPVGLPHWDPAGMWPAAELARDEINTAGGVHLPGGDYQIVLESGNEHSIPDPNPDAAVLEVDRLINVEGCDFIVGGFRSEVVGAMIEKAMELETIFLINGAATNELISETVREPPGNYEKYKYLFRVNPVNDTVLFYTIAAYMKFSLIPQLLPLYGYVHTGMTVPQVDIAVLLEDYEWTNLFDTMFTNPAIYPGVLGPNVNVTYAARFDPTTSDFSSYLTAVANNEARVIIHIISGTEGIPFIIQWKSMNIKAIPMGINVMAQLQTHPTYTGGACENEGTLAFGGTRTPITPESVPFWDAFVAKTGVWPIYTATGAYSALYILKEAIEAAGTLNTDDVITALEALDTTGVAGRFKFTEDHDFFSNEPGPMWTQGYARAFFVQWQAGRMEVVHPLDRPYSRATALPNNPGPPNQMYPYPTDVNQDGEIDMTDVSAVGLAFGSSPGDERWVFLADVNDVGTSHWFIDSDDNVPVCADYGKSVALPLGYDDEAGHLS